MADGSPEAQLILLETRYFDAGTETYLLPLYIASGARPASHRRRYGRRRSIARFADGILHEAISTTRGFRAALFDHVHGGRPRRPWGVTAAFPGENLASPAGRTSALPRAQGRAEQQLHHLRRPLVPEALPPHRGRHQSRRGNHPLPERAPALRVRPALWRLHRIPPAARRDRACWACSLGLVPNEGDAWTRALDSLGRFYERVLEEKPGSRLHPAALPLHADGRPAPSSPALIGGVHPERVRQLGERTAAHALRAGRRRRPTASFLARSPSPRSTSAPFTNRCAARSAGRSLLQRHSRASRRATAGSSVLEPRRGIEQEILARVRRRLPATEDRLLEDPHPWRFPSRPGAQHRQGFRHHRLRGRARAP